ncbi:hypothetical protein ThimaDRAFT_3708 [Thiocapsa marina 5811]|uniref:Uncharacterized protein n=1 Tax=Thiocapsa marina 5811 TaxID=768671 RepID=F9UFK5_9GAMM|nr:hypothetical protein ThimaDRAFT_3708 [Thiocapsa marina 5811]
MIARMVALVNALAHRAWTRIEAVKAVAYVERL